MRLPPSQWAAENRVYPPYTDFPGPRDPWLTPYVVAISDAVVSGRFKRVAVSCGAQMGKTELMLDLIGQRLDQRPAPVIYCGPTRAFVVDQFEPRVMALLDEAPMLAAKVARGKRMKQSRKIISGVTLRLAHGGSSSELKSSPAAFALVDEYDEMLANIKGQGDPLGLIEARGYTYADFVTVVASTPSTGSIETEIDPVSGLEFWKVAESEDLTSPIWKLWQEGTRFHWSWKCPHCSAWFVPRSKLLKWPKDATPAEARRAAYVAAPCCGGVIEEGHKTALNAGGRYLAPGQTVNADGEVEGLPPDNSTASFWVSGLCSPFVTLGERAEDYLKAQASAEPAKIQTAVNAGFGEVWTPVGADAPEWTEVAKLRQPYRAGEVPDGVLFLTAGIDVHGLRLNYVVRGWGVRQESWLIEQGELWGDTKHPHVWGDLSDLLEKQFDGLTIRRAFIDAGFRPGNKETVPVHMVYDFCRRNSRVAFPSKGFEHRDQPVSFKRIEVTVQGKTSKVGVDLARIDTDHCKSFVHARIRWPDDQKGGWHIYQDATDDYCKQIVAESRVKKPSGGFTWVERGENHFLDAEALAYAAAWTLRVYAIGDNVKRRTSSPAVEEKNDAPPAVVAKKGVAGLARLNAMGR